ncbi:MAG: glycosyltransferase [Methylacidiphilaceae bacterium]|nr:glycosyltransferase [Candidatus Methylacidiphilaceae bacterium]
MRRWEDLSLATTVHHNAAISARMLSSFEEHVGEAAEIVLVDDASARPFAESPPPLRSPVRIIRNERASGFCAASHQALSAVRTRYALLVDADVIFLPGDFPGGFEAFCQAPGLAWCTFRQLGCDGKVGDAHVAKQPPPWVFGLGNQVGAVWSRWTAKPVLPEVRGRIAFVEIAYSSSAMVDMEIYRKVGGFDLDLWQCETDPAFCLKLGRAGYKVGVDLGYTVIHEAIGYRTGGDPRTFDLYRGRLWLYERYYPSCRYYLRALLWARHLAEMLYFAFLSRFRPEPAQQQLSLRRRLFQTVGNGYGREA